MLDIIAATFVTAAYTIVVGALVGFSPVSIKARLAAFAAAAAWLAIILTVAAFGWLAPGVLGPVPANLLPFTGLLVLLFGAGSSSRNSAKRFSPCRCRFWWG
jgi:hypothetical protein